MKYIFCALVFLYSCGSTAQMKKATDDKPKVETDTIKDSTKIAPRLLFKNLLVVLPGRILLLCTRWL